MKDVRLAALRRFAISISVFNVLGYIWFGFEQPWSWPVMAVLTAYATEIGLETVSAWAERSHTCVPSTGSRGKIPGPSSMRIGAASASCLRTGHHGNRSGGKNGIRAHMSS